MTEIKCRNCGKKFEDTSGASVCPYCFTTNQTVSKFQNIYDMLDSESQEFQEQKYRTSKKIMISLIVAIVVCILCIVGIPVFIVFRYVKSDEAGYRTAYYKELYGQGEILEAMEKQEGIDFLVEKDPDIQLRVNGAWNLLVNKNRELLPEGEKIVAISFTQTTAGADLAKLVDNPIGEPYVGYDQYFKETFGSYYLTEVLEMKGPFHIFSHDVCIYDGDNTGYLYALLPENTTEFWVYFDVRDLESKHVKSIYKIHVSIDGEVSIDEE